MKTTGFTAKRLRIVLAFVMVLIAASAGGGFFYVQRQLSDYATTITKLNADAQSGDESINTLRELQAKLDKEQSTIELAQSLVADQTTYNDRVISDLTRISKESGISITSFNFSSSDSAVAAQSPAPSGGASAPTKAPGVVAPAGITQKSIAINTQSPVSYNSLMKFLQLIETNPLKMQVNSVSMTKGEGNNVTTNAFLIQVYVR